MSTKISKVVLAANATAEKVFTYVPERRTKSLKIINRGAAVVDYGFANTVVTGKGITIAVNAEEFIDDLKQDLWIIAAVAATSKLIIVEEFYGEDV